MCSRLLSGLILLGVLSGIATAQEKAAYILRLGADTLSIEQVTRTASQLKGEFVLRTPRTTHRSYTMDLAPDGSVKRLELVIRNLDGAPPAETRSTIAFMGDTAITTAPRGDSTVTTRVAAGKGAIPLLNGSVGFIDQLGRQARAAKEREYKVDLVSPGARQPTPAFVTKRGGDTLAYDFETPVGRVGTWLLRVDPKGRLLAYSGKGSPFAVEMERVPSVDIARTNAMYANRPLGQLSVRDTVRADVDSAGLWIDYGRPSLRGREVFGTIVPWNTVWRTGANAATQFHTPIPLAIGGAPVPAGTYTLWTLPTPSGWKLIINKQTGQWGTVYDPAQDLVRVDMQVASLPAPVELLTIAFVGEGADRKLQIDWDRTRVSVPIAKGN